ncbi:BamA/TamA family outer membrane protein, partial [Burkholderia vietnamiensis]|uniref:BamA/TamA family outer membrane protein n=1 Tax=Burkholderia vietnamiensis TaxID=60552 RepID=UPI001FC8D9B3
DAVIHAAFDHDFSNFVANCEKDKRAIAALGSALKGSNRPLLITSGTGVGSGEHGEPASEDVFNTRHPNPRIGSEEAGNALLEAGVNVSVMRLPQVHNPYRQGLVSTLVEIARDNRDSTLIPSRGYFLQANAEYGTPIAATTYVKSDLQAQYYYSFARGFILGLNFQGIS